MQRIRFILLLTIPLIGFGQGWEQTYGGTSSEYGNSVKQTSDGGYIIAGTADGAYMLKTNETGGQTWSQTIGSGQCRDIQLTLDGGYIVTGKSGTLFLMKTDSFGQEEWVEYGTWEWAGDGHSVQQTSDGGYIVAGVGKESQFNQDILLLKTDENGNWEWSFFYDLSNDVNVTSQGYSIQQTDDGGYIITGRTNCCGDSGIFLIKISENGQQLWQQSFAGDSGQSVKQTSDGGYIISGDDLNYDFLLIKTDENGEEEWSQTFGRGIGNDIQLTSDGGYIVTGRKYDIDDTSDAHVFLLKIDENGEEEWSRTFGGPNTDEGQSVQQTTDGGYIICGTKSNYNIGNYFDIYLIKTDPEGYVETTSTIELPNPTSKRELIKTTNILGQENTTIKNQPMIEIYDDGSVEKRYIIE